MSDTHQVWTSLVLNSLGLLSNIYGLYAINYLYVNPYAVAFGGHLQYLTIIGLLAATLAFALRLIQFAFPGSLKKTYELVVNIATPLEGLITFLYWSMALVNPRLLSPKDLPPPPLHLDFALHLVPAILLWTNFFWFNLEFKRSVRHIITIYGFVVFYYVWSWYCKTRNGYWPYPFLNAFSDSNRAVFFFGCGTLCWLMYETGAFFHAKINRVKEVLDKKLE
ncbi:FAR-17a/AIG1-like protein [Phycomyces nitens]|nr:FAR-17a/AIG1-like protein [Phycomyces nitens]